jgi:hypothetical protein
MLHIRQGSATEWSFTVGVWVEAPEPTQLNLTFDPGAQAVVSAAPVKLGTFDRGDWLSWTVRMPRRATEFRTSYTLSGFSEGAIQIDHVAIPALGQAPRLAFFSCNGVQDKKDWTSRPEMERTWIHMLKCHKADPNPDGSGGPYHVLVGGGDQIYCDAVWNDIPELQTLNTWEKRKKKKVSPTLARKIETLYADLYQRWRQSTFGDLHARIPGAYTWDDHDIFDGWGSYDRELQSCDLFKEIFATARRAFMLFQLGIGAGESNLCLDLTRTNFLQAVRFDQYDILLLDLRSDRTDALVMGAAQWKLIKAYLTNRLTNEAPPPHLLIVSSIPLVYLNFGVTERLLDWLPLRQEFEDDLRDQWESKAHQEERARLIMTLLDHAATARTRVSILSGDVHVGARGRIVSRRPEHLLANEAEAVIHQLTSSAIVYPPPGSFALAGMRSLAKEGPSPLLAVSHVDTEVVPLGAEHFLLGANNWLSVEPDANWSASKQRLWVRWITVKGDAKPPLLVHRRS